MSSRAQPSRELATVLVTDIVDSTSQLARSGQVRAHVRDALDAITRSEVRRRGGEVVGCTGDAALMLMPGPTTAVECAAALHAGARRLGVALRVGAHTGEVERRGGEVSGTAVLVAERLMSAAAAGETLVSAAVRGLASPGEDGFETRDDLDLPGFAEPVSTYAFRQQDPSSHDVEPVTGEVDAVARLIEQLRFEEAAELAEAVDPEALVGVVVAAGGRIEFLDVDVTLVRILRDLLDRLPDNDRVGRARVAAKLAFELRGDPSTVDERRALLESATGVAEAAADDIAVSETLIAAIHALWEPAGAPDRLAAAERVIGLTQRTHHIDHELEARLARVHALVELWRVHEAGLELATYARLAVRLERPDVLAFVASRRSMLAQISGRYDEQSRQGEIAHHNAVLAGMPDAERLRITHLWPHARDCVSDRDVLEASLSMLTELAQLMPGNYYDLDVARVLLELGRPEDARLELVRGLPPLFTSTGYRWLLAAANAAIVAAAVGSEHDCVRLHQALLPHDDRLLVQGPLFEGAVGDVVGLLEVRLGMVTQAVDRLRRTVEALEEIAALPWVVRTRIHLAEALRAAGDLASAEGELTAALETARALGMHRVVDQIEAVAMPATDVWVLQRDGDDWLLDAGPERVRLRANRGLAHLAALLANPGRDVPAHQLDAGAHVGPSEEGVPMLDEQALNEYRRRLQEIDAALEAADRVGDEHVAAQLEEEREFLLAEVRRATGLGGRRRTSGGAAERARVNVTRNLKRAIEQVVRHAPLAGAHLTASIRTGLQCRYDPAVGGPSGWEVVDR